MSFFEDLGRSNLMGHVTQAIQGMGAIQDMEAKEQAIKTQQMQQAKLQYEAEEIKKKKAFDSAYVPISSFDPEYKQNPSSWDLIKGTLKSMGHDVREEGGEAFISNSAKADIAKMQKQDVEFTAARIETRIKDISDRLGQTGNALLELEQAGKGPGDKNFDALKMQEEKLKKQLSVGITSQRSFQEKLILETEKINDFIKKQAIINAFKQEGAKAQSPYGQWAADNKLDPTKPETKQAFIDFSKNLAESKQKEPKPPGSLAEFEEAYKNKGGDIEAIKGTPKYEAAWQEWKKATLAPGAQTKIYVQNVTNASREAEKSKGMDIPSLADAVSNGQDARMAIKGSMGNPVATKVQTEVLKKYPKFDFGMSDANYKWKQSATNQRTINFVGGALPRLSSLDEQLQKLPNVDLNAINRVMRAVSIETGKPEYTNFESNRNAIVQEINTALSGSSQGSDMRIQIELENLKSARSPKQIKGAISNLREALIARMDVDLSPIYPIEVVQGKKSMSQYKEEMFKKYRGNYGGGSNSTSGSTPKSRFQILEVK